MIKTALFSVCFATGYVHSGEIKIFKASKTYEFSAESGECCG